MAVFCNMDVRKIIVINKLIKGERTGTPKDLAKTLAISERTAHVYLSFMRKQLNAPIKWNKTKSTYAYEQNGELKMEWVNK